MCLLYCMFGYILLREQSCIYDIGRGRVTSLPLVYLESSVAMLICTQPCTCTMRCEIWAQPAELPQ